MEAKNVIKGKHLVFYDGVCGLCDQAVQFVLRHDKNDLFLFAPLQGETAKKYDLPKDIDSIVLVENFGTHNEKLLVMGKAVFRICWLLGGFFTLIGWLSFLPSWLYDFGYRFVAKRRHIFFKNTSCVIPTKESKIKFLP